MKICHFLLTIQSILGYYKLESVKLMDDWNNDVLRDAGYYHNNPSTRNAVYAYVERLKSTELKTTDEMAGLPSILCHHPIGLDSSRRLEESIQRMLSSTTFSVMNDPSYPQHNFQSYVIEKSYNKKVTMHKSLYLYLPSTKESCDNAEALSLIRNTLESEKTSHPPYIQHIVYKQDIFANSTTNPILKPDSYDKVSVFLLPLKWDGIEHNCKDPLEALVPQFNQAKFAKIHGNERNDAIIVDKQELKEVYKMLDEMLDHFKNINNTIKTFHNYSNRYFAEVSTGATLESPRERQHKSNQDIACAKQHFSETVPIMKRDPEPQIKDTEFSSTTPLTQSSSDISTATIGQVFSGQQQASESLDHLEEATEGFCFT